jgi:hypothetical protein
MTQGTVFERSSRAARALLVAAISAVVCLTACAPDADPPRTQPLTAEEAASRTMVPLTRPFPLVAMAEPLVLDFEVPPPGRNSSATLSVGLRVSGTDLKQVVEVRDTLAQARMPAVMSLTDPDGAVVPLYRRHDDGYGLSEVVLVGADGYVPGVVGSSVDDTALDHARLVRTDRTYRVLGFAWAGQTKPGRYQLKIQLIDPEPDLSAIQAELLLAFRHKGK